MLQGKKYTNPCLLFFLRGVAAGSFYLNTGQLNARSLIYFVGLRGRNIGLLSNGAKAAGAIYFMMGAACPP